MMSKNLRFMECDVVSIEQHAGDLVSKGCSDVKAPALLKDCA